jgi:transglutaminase-like putative cysteine protease
MHITFVSNCRARARWAVLAGGLALAVLPAGRASADTLFTVRQTFVVENVPATARTVRGWFWMPEDRPEQQVLEFRVVDAPATFRITRDPRYGRSWLYAEAAAAAGHPLRVVSEFRVIRRPVTGRADASLATPLTAAHRRAFAPELRKDEKLMEVTPGIQELAASLAGRDPNPVLQARRFFDYVIEKSEHYSKSGPSPKGLCLGSAHECMIGTGDCCTDQHALFIALCRAQGIPCRLVFGSRLKPENEGKPHDPGYRCWPSFFAPGLGWVPLDISSADAAGDSAAHWFGGLDANRLEWAEGRDFELEPRSSVRPDLVIRGWVEVDGQPSRNLVRTLEFKAEPWPSGARPAGPASAVRGSTLHHAGKERPDPRGVAGHIEGAIAGQPENDRRVDQAQEQHGERGRRHVRPETPRFLSLGNQRRHLPQVPLDELVDLAPAPGVPGEEVLGEHHPRDGGVAAEELDMALQQPLKAPQGVRGLRAHGADVLAQPLRNHPQHGREDRVLPGVMPVNRRRHHADLPG